MSRQERDGQLPLDIPKPEETMPSFFDIRIAMPKNGPARLPSTHTMFVPLCDGWRTLLWKKSDNIVLGNPTRHTHTNEKFVEHVVNELRSIPDDVILDGDLVALDKNGHHQPKWVLGWRNFPGASLKYFVHDILYFSEEDLRGSKLIEREKTLRELIDDLTARFNLRHTAALPYFTAKHSPPQDLLAQFRSKGSAGLMAKDPHSQYRGGKSGDWLSYRSLDY